MIQRIQSVYLFVTAVLTVCLFVLPYVAIGNAFLMFNVTVFRLSPEVPGMQATTMLPLTAITLCAAVLCLIAIFMYGNRTRQMKVVKLNIVLQAVLLIGMVAYLFGIKNTMGASVTFSPKFAFAFPVISIVLLFLAYRGIKADDDLVKSADRLR